MGTSSRVRRTRVVAVQPTYDGGLRMRDLIARRNLILFGLLILGVFFTAGLQVTAHALPFTPFRVNYYTAVPPDGCPGDEVPIQANYNLVIPNYVQVDPIIPVKSWWLDKDGFEIPAGSGDIELSDLKRGRHLTYTSPILRRAPTGPGKYRLVSEVHMTGRIFGAKREHFFRTPAYDTFTVLEPGSPTCRS